MARYIDEKFIRAAMFHPLPYTHITPPDVDVESFKRGWNDALDAVLANSQSADVRENVRGEWLKGGEQPYFRKHFDIVVCSVCNKRGEQRWNFCPNCGADMRTKA